MDLGPRQHEDIPQSTCHNDLSLVACSRPIHRLKIHVGDDAYLDMAIWRFYVSSNVRLGEVRVWWQSLASASAQDPKNGLYFFYPSGF
jgi:hypothetical protein